MARTPFGSGRREDLGLHIDILRQEAMLPHQPFRVVNVERDSREREMLERQRHEDMVHREREQREREREHMERQREHTALAESPIAFSELQLVTNLGAQPASTIPTPFFENRINGRVDYTINNKNSAYLSITTQANNSTNDQSNGFFDLTEGNFTVNHLQLANLTLNSTLSNTTVNSFTFGFQYWNNVIDSAIRVPLITFPGGGSNNCGAGGSCFGTNANVY